MLDLWACQPASCSSPSMANDEMASGLAAHATPVNALRSSNGHDVSQSCSARMRHKPFVYQYIAIAPIKTRNMRVSCPLTSILRGLAICLRFSLRLNASGNPIQGLSRIGLDGQKHGLKRRFWSQITRFCVLLHRLFFACLIIRTFILEF